MSPVNTSLFVRRSVPRTRGVYALIIARHLKTLCVPLMEPHTITSVYSSEKCAISRQTSPSIIREIVQVTSLSHRNAVDTSEYMHLKWKVRVSWKARQVHVCAGDDDK